MVYCALHKISVLITCAKSNAGRAEDVLLGRNRARNARCWSPGYRVITAVGFVSTRLPKIRDLYKRLQHLVTSQPGFTRPQLWLGEESTSMDVLNAHILEVPKMNQMRCLATAAVFCMSPCLDSIAAAETIPIGLVAPISGSVALDGQQEMAGARFAVDQANKAGGIRGTQLELFVEDGECKPASSTAAAEKLITRNQIIALAGGFCSSATAAMQPISAKYGVPFVNGISTNPALTNPVRPWFFRVKAHDGIRAKYFSKFIADAKMKKLAAIAVDDDFGRSAVASFTPALNEKGVEFVLVRHFAHGEVNYISLLNAAKGAGADGLFLVGEVQDAALIMKQYHQLGLKIPVVAMGSFNTPEFFKVAGANADGIYTAEAWGYGVDYPAAKIFVNNWEAAHSKDYPGLYATSGYNETQTIIEALRKAAKPDRAEVKTALEGLTWDSPIGLVKFDANHQAHTLIFVTKNENGKGLIVKTFDTSAE